MQSDTLEERYAIKLCFKLEKMQQKVWNVSDYFSIILHCGWRRLLRRGQEFHVYTINKSAHMKKVWKLIVCTSYHMDTNKTHGEKPNGNYTRMLHAILNKSWNQHPTKQQLDGHLPPLSKTISTRHARHCWRSKDKLRSNFFLLTTTHGCASVG